MGALAFVGCRQPAAPQQEVVAVSPAVALQISTAETAVTFAPNITDVPFNQYKVLVVRRNGATVNPYDGRILKPVSGDGTLAVSFSLRLPVGLYSVTVDACNSNNGARAATTTKPLTVTNSGAKICAFTLQPIADDGTGTLAWRLMLPTDVTGALVLTNSQGAQSIPVQCTGAEVPDSKEVDAGRYNIRLILANKSGTLQVTPLDATCVIYAGLSTEITGGDYTKYTFDDTIPVSGDIIIDNPSRATTSAVVVTAYDADGNPFEPAVTRTYAVGTYTGEEYRQAYSLALPASAFKTRPIIRASFSEPSNAYHVTATDDFPPNELSQEGAKNVNPKLTLTTDTATIRGTVTVDNPACINLGAVSVTDTVTFTRTQATLVGDPVDGVYTYNYVLELPPGAIGTTPSIKVTFDAYLGRGADGGVTAVSGVLSAVTKGCVDGVDFRAHVYCLTAQEIRVPATLAAFVANRVNEVGTDTIYLLGDLTSADLKTLGAAIGNATVKLDMLCGRVTDGLLPADAFANCGGLTSVAIGGGIKSVSAGAFAHCASLESVNIGVGVETVGESVFTSCAKLSAITVDKRNTRLCSFDGTLYSRDETTLIAYAPGNKARSFIVPECVTTVAARAFSNCPALEDIVMLDGLRTVGDGAFSGCTALKTVVLPDSLFTISAEMFRGCTALVNMPEYNSVRVVGDLAFSDCTGIMSVVLKPSVTTVGNRAFDKCTSLNTLHIGENVQSIGEYAFASCKNLIDVHIGDSVQFLGQRAFVECSSIKSVYIGNSVKDIHDSTFENCHLIEKLYIGNSVRTIGSSAFSECLAIEEIKLPDSLQSIGERAFLDSKKFVDVVIPDNVRSIGDYAFAGCNCIKSVILGSGLQTIGVGAFRYAFQHDYKGLDRDGYYLNHDWDEIVIPDNVVFIGDKAFDECRSLQKATIGKGLTAINTGTFQNCLYLETIVIPGTVKRIGDSAFFNCASLRSIEFGEGVETIGVHAFRGCYRFNYASSDNWVAIGIDIGTAGHERMPIKFPSSLKTLGRGAFSECTHLPGVYVCDNTTLEANVFNECHDLKSVRMCAGITVPTGIRDKFDDFYASIGRLEGAYKWHKSKDFADNLGAFIPNKGNWSCDR
jgi:hypothetical protein